MILEEFMVVKNITGEYAVLIKHDNTDYPFRMVYKTGGQIVGHRNMHMIHEVYASKRKKNNDIIFNALQFLTNPNFFINDYQLIYTNEQEEVEEKLF